MKPGEKLAQVLGDDEKPGVQAKLTQAKLNY